MSIFNYLELQPLETENGDEISDLDKFEADETFDLLHDEDPSEIQSKLDQELEDLKNDPLTFTEE